MIPVHSSDLDSLSAEVERQRAELESLVEPLDAHALVWRPDATRWSLAGHVEHLCIVNGPYLDTMDDAIAAARRRGGAERDGPYKHPLLARWFVRAMEPPPGTRLRTARKMVPDPAVNPAVSMQTFVSRQDRLASLIDSARGLDLGSVRFSSPFLKLLRLSLGSGFEVLLAHNRRHIWLVRELMSSDAFPGTSPTA